MDTFVMRTTFPMNSICFESALSIVYKFPRNQIKDSRLDNTQIASSLERKKNFFFLFKSAGLPGCCCLAYRGRSATDVQRSERGGPEIAEVHVISMSEPTAFYAKTFFTGRCLLSSRACVGERKKGQRYTREQKAKSLANRGKNTVCDNLSHHFFCLIVCA